MTPLESPVRRRGLGRDLVLWCGSFLLAATALKIYVRAPILPLVLAGGLTLVMTLIRHFTAEKRKI